MKSRRVIVKDFAGLQLVRVVCYTTDSAVFVTTENEFQNIKSGTSDLKPIGFPRADVFCYEPSLGSQVDWSKLRPWVGSVGMP